MRRSSDPEVRRSASAAVSIESLDETAARDAVSVTRDGVQQIVAAPSPAPHGPQLERNSKSMQSLGEASAANGHVLNGSSHKSLQEAGADAVELAPLTGGAVATVRYNSS